MSGEVPATPPHGQPPPLISRIRFAGELASITCVNPRSQIADSRSALVSLRRVIRRQLANAICRRTNSPRCLSSGKVFFTRETASAPLSSTALKADAPQRSANNRRYCETREDGDSHTQNAEQRDGKPDTQRGVPRQHDNHGDGKQEVGRSSRV